jgi:hypothetical protein
MNELNLDSSGLHSLPSPAQNEPEKSGPKGRMSRRRLILLLGVLILVAAVGAFHHLRTWYYERELMQMAKAIVDDYNANDPVPVSPEGPEADVDVNVTASRQYLLFGPMTGKITLTIIPRPHAPDLRIGGVSYVYDRVGDEWKLIESYHE